MALDHFAANHFAAHHFAALRRRVARVSGGDDAPRRHPGWSRKAWRRRKDQEDALEQTISAVYLRALGIEPDPVIVEAIADDVADTAQPVETPDFAAFMAWVQDQHRLIESIIAKRRQEEEDDEEALLLLI